MALARPATGGGPPPVALVLRALGLGDLLVAVPALRGLRRALPEHRLVLAAPAALEPLVRLTGAVDDLLPSTGLDAPLADGPTIRTHPAGSADPAAGGTGRPAVAVNLHGRGPRSTALLRATCPGVLWTHGDGGPQWMEDQHEVARWCRLLATYGVPADPADLRLERPAAASAAPGAVLVHPGAAHGSRRWPADRFAAVTAGLRDAGHRVVLTGGPAERDLALSVARAAGLSTADVHAGRTDLAGLAALVAGASLVVCGDTGVAHLATAYETPSVLLFGPVSPARWGPPAGPHTVLWRGDGTGDPHGAEPDPALLALTSAEVLGAALLRLDRRPASAAAAP